MQPFQILASLRIIRFMGLFAILLPCLSPLDAKVLVAHGLLHLLILVAEATVVLALSTLKL